MTVLLAAVAATLSMLLFRRGPDRRTRLRRLRIDDSGQPDRRAGALGDRRLRTAAVRIGLPAIVVMATALGLPPPIVVSLVVVVALTPVVIQRRHRKRAVDAAEAATVEAVFALAAELRAGRPPSRALALVATQTATLGAALSSAAAAVAAGASAGSELRRIADQPGCSGLRGVAAAWEVTADVGGPVADVIDRLGEVLDAEQQARSSLAAALAGPRTTMFLLASLPVFGLALGQMMGANPLHLLLHRPLGWALLAAAAAFDTVGVGWTAAIIRRSLR